MTIPLNAKAILDSSEFQKGVDQMRSSGTDASKDIGGAFSQMGLSSVAAFTAVGSAIAATTKFLADCSIEAQQDEVIMTRLDTTLIDMGRSGDVSAAGLEKTAMNLQEISGINHDDILQAYNAIAKFENLDTSAMDRIVKDAIDMFAGGEGGSVAENANVVARVLETGVIPRTWGFSAALKTTIQDEVKAGDTTKALADTLGMLEQRFGGQAAAAMETEAGQARRLAADFKTLEEEIGQKLLPTELKLVQFADLIITAQDKIKNALSEHDVAVQKTTTNYNDYWREMIRAYDASKGVTISETQLTHALLTLPLDDTAKKFNFLTQAEYEMMQATYAVGYQSTATKEALEQQMPALEAIPPAIDKATRALNDQNFAVQYATGYQQEYESNARSMADAEKQLQEDRKAGWWETSQKIQDDKQAINDLQADHTKALLQMIVDVNMYKWQQDKALNPEEIAEKSLKLQKSLGLITQAEYDLTMQALAAADAINSIPSSPGGSGGPAGKGHNYGGGGYAEGTEGLMQVPSGYPNDTYPMRLSSGEGVQVIPSSVMAGGGGGGGGMVLNNYGTLVVQGHEDVQESLLAQLRA